MPDHIHLEGSGRNLQELQWICQATLQSCFPIFRDAKIQASFYPYIGLTHTIRRKGTVWELRISDHFRHAPRSVLEAISLILGCKVLRRKPPAWALGIYESFRQQPEIVESAHLRRLKRGRKQISQREGRFHSLSEIYRNVNGGFFNNQVEIRKIGWGRRNSRLRLGHYDPTHHTITVSPVLDSPEVPAYVVAYIVYHEMLHTLFEIKHAIGRNRHHPPAFKKAERAFPEYDKAKKFLAGFCRGKVRS